MTTARDTLRVGGARSHALPLALMAALAAPCALAGESVAVRAHPLALEERRPEREEVGVLRFLAGFELRSAHRRFGGLSGLLVEPDGDALITVSDRGTIWRARLEHDDRGRLVALSDWRMWRLAHAAWEPNGRRRDDAESLTWLEDGGIAVAFEQRHRIRRLPVDDLGAELQPMPTPPGIEHAPRNEGIEALTALSDGSLLAISEGLFNAHGHLRAWRIVFDRSEAMAYVPEAGFRPTGASRVGGRVFVLERRLSLLGGFQARIVELAEAEIREGARLRGRELARLQPPMTVDNMEGLAARRLPDGRIALYLISDDNFVFLQRTILLQFAYEPEDEP